jgi:RNA polymerase sigma-70 factor (ECF subfamily)
MTEIEFNNKLIEIKPDLKRYAMSLTKDYEKSNDLLQDTYFRAIKYKNYFAINTNFNAWVFTIMKNIFINDYRKSVTRNIIDNNDINDLQYINKSSDKGFFSPESIYAENEMLIAIKSLNDIFRIPFKMYIEGYKYKEIADKLNLNIGTIKSRIFFARKNLMLILKD